MITLGYEHFRDDARRRPRHPLVPGPAGGRPASSTFFGDPASATCDARVNVASAAFEHQAGSLHVRNRTLSATTTRSTRTSSPAR